MTAKITFSRLKTDNSKKRRTERTFNLRLNSVDVAGFQSVDYQQFSVFWVNQNYPLIAETVYALELSGKIEEARTQIKSAVQTALSKSDEAKPKVVSVESIIDTLDHEIRYAEKTISEWAEQVIDNPANSLENSGQTFFTAARLKVCRTLKNNLVEFNDLDKDNLTSDDVSNLINDLDRTAKWAHEDTHATSSSVPLNEMRRCLATEWYRLWYSETGMLSMRNKIIRAIS